VTVGNTGSAAANPGPISILKCANCGAANRIKPSPRGAPHCGTCGKPLPWLVTADEGSFELETRAAPTVIVDLWAPWCGPCRFVGPILEELAQELAGRLKVVKVNVDENQRLALRYDARSIPTMLVMRDGEVVDRIVGAMPKPELSARILPYLRPPRGQSDATAEASAAR
jgi:thioredoxin 2